MPFVPTGSGPSATRGLKPETYRVSGSRWSSMVTGSSRLDRAALA
jgi:hypothetical protein